MCKKIVQPQVDFDLYFKIEIEDGFVQIPKSWQFLNLSDSLQKSHVLVFECTLPEVTHIVIFSDAERNHVKPDELYKKIFTAFPAIYKKISQREKEDFYYNIFDLPLVGDIVPRTDYTPPYNAVIVKKSKKEVRL